MLAIIPCVQVCSRVTMAVNLYKDVQLFPGASTQRHLLSQHGLYVNGPMFPNPAEGPVCLLSAANNGQAAVVKMLPGPPLPDSDPLPPDWQEQLQADHAEAIAVRCVLYMTCMTCRHQSKASMAQHASRVQPHAPSIVSHTQALLHAHCRDLMTDKPDDVALAETTLVCIDLTQQHSSTGRGRGRYCALIMPQYVTTLAKLLHTPAEKVLVQGQRMREALQFIHSRGYVHMDVKVGGPQHGCITLWVIHDPMTMYRTQFARSGAV